MDGRRERVVRRPQRGLITAFYNCGNVGGRIQFQILQYLSWRNFGKISAIEEDILTYRLLDKIKLNFACFCKNIGQFSTKVRSDLTTWYLFDS